VTDDRAGDPARGSRPGAPGSDVVRSPAARTGPASAPFRIPVATPTAQAGRRPTMVPLTRKRGPRLGLRPPGAAGLDHPVLPGGHFLQEECGEQLGQVIAGFVRGTR